MMELFWAFLKIGAFAFGGAYGAIPLIRDTVLSHGWMDAQMFANLTAVAESTPGPIMVNLATYVGAAEAGLPGALAATLGVVLPSFVLILLVSAAFRSLLGYPAVRAALQGIKPCLAGLILAAGVGLCSDAVFSGGGADPVAAAVLGALLYFGVYPRDFDSTLPALAPMMEQAGISRGTAVSLLLGVLVYGPVINLFFAIGEEIGWRGFLYPALRQRMFTLPACLLVGAIWGLWHTPINLMGHNYGTSYPGFPWLGILGMCLFTTSAGTFLAWLSERSGSLWPAALAHGTINAAAQVALLFRGAEGAVRQIWGPAVTGILAGMPMLVLSAVLLVRKGSWRKSW